MSATIHPSSIILRCDLCKHPMIGLGDKAWCTNPDCAVQGKMFKVEYPSVDVKLTECVE
jgi:hypothetical protein